MEYLVRKNLALSVRNPIKAALLLAHGYQLSLPPDPVGQWTYEFASLADYLAWSNGDRHVRVREVITWNIQCGLAEPLLRAHTIMHHREDPNRHPNFAAAWAYLIAVAKTRPREALWIIVRDPDARNRLAFAMFGRNADERTQEEMLNDFT